MEEPYPADEFPPEDGAPEVSSGDDSSLPGDDSSLPGDDDWSPAQFSLSAILGVMVAASIIFAGFQYEEEIQSPFPYVVLAAAGFFAYSVARLVRLSKGKDDG